MASPERPGALVAAPAAAQRCRGLIRLGTQLGRLFIGYLASAVASTVALFSWLVIVDFVTSGIFDLSWSLLWAMLAFDYSIPIVWIPFSVSLPLLLVITRRPFVSCCLAGAFTGVALVDWLTAVYPHDTSDFVPPTLQSLSGQLRYALLVGILPGVVGGIAFWIVCFREDRRARLASGYLAAVAVLVLAAAAGDLAAKLVRSGPLPIGDLVDGFGTSAYAYPLEAALAWMPFFAVLVIWLKARQRPIEACLVSGTITGAIFVAWSSRLSAAQTIGSGVLAGLLAGLVFWSLCYRRGFRLE